MKNTVIKIGICLSVLVLLAGCAAKKVVIDFKPAPKVAVLDFSLPGKVTNERELHGWWLGARDHFHNTNAGVIFADILAEKLNATNKLHVYKRSEFKYFMADLREELKDKYSDLDKEENEEKLEEIITGLDPIVLGKSLNVDKVIVGSLDMYYTSHHRTFHWWSSKIGMKVKMLDVATGKVEWEDSVVKRKSFHAPEIVAEKIVDSMVKELEKKHLTEYRKEVF